MAGEKALMAPVNVLARTFATCSVRALRRRAAQSACMSTDRLC